MKRVEVAERPDWKEKAEQLGFIFHTMYGQKYWDESAYYSFTLGQVEKDIEDPTDELHQMCLDLVDRVVSSEELMSKLSIPMSKWDFIAKSWANVDPTLYGRFDLAYNGQGPAKMLEYNADTPTSLYESAYFQWLWLDDMINSASISPLADQYNSIQEELIGVFKSIFTPKSHVFFTAAENVSEDRQTVKYLEDCARQAGLINHYVDLEQIGHDARGNFCATMQDGKDYIIEALFKLYPYEEMFQEDYSFLLGANDTKFLEPAWKAILSNKAFLPLIWQFNKGHPNLLPSYFENDTLGDDLGSMVVRKPIFSREGANVSIKDGSRVIEEAEGEYGDEGYILQSYSPLPVFGENHTVIGSWVVGNKACGMGIREDNCMITKDLSRFLPHVILD